LTAQRIHKNAIKCPPSFQINHKFIRINTKIIMWKLRFLIIIKIKLNIQRTIKKKDSEGILGIQKLEFRKNKSILKKDHQNISINKIK
jgi:hypothetical protein